MSLKYILDGHTPVACDDAHEWAEWFETSREARRVGLDEIDGLRVSTVFLALDQRIPIPPGPGEVVVRLLPILFETEVRGKLGGEGDDIFETERYTTWEEAESAHKAVCALLRAPVEPEPRGTPFISVMIDEGRTDTEVPDPSPRRRGTRRP